MFTFRHREKVTTPDGEGLVMCSAITPDGKEYVTVHMPRTKESSCRDGIKRQYPVAEVKAVETEPVMKDDAETTKTTVPEAGLPGDD